VTLVPPSLELVVNVEESRIGQVAEGQSVQLQVPAFPNRTFTGTVKSISPTIDSKSRTAAVRIEPQDDGTNLRAGMFARLNIVTAEKAGALMVPNAALSAGTASAQPLVLEIDPSGRIHRQPVQIGLQNDQFTEVVSGIDAGQLVATSSINDLAEGDIVTPQITNPTTADVLH
jgi:RND family efflux transporter MFP subunit